MQVVGEKCCRKCSYVVAGPIGRVLERGGVKKFQKMALEKVCSLKDIKSIEQRKEYCQTQNRV